MRKSFVMLLIATLATSSLTGCSLFEKTTAEGLVAEGLNTLYNAESMEMNMSMDIAVTAEIEDGFTMDMGVEIAGDVESEGEISHAEMDMGITAMGMNFEESVETWSKVDDDETVTYTKTGEDGNWIIETADGVDTEGKDVEVTEEDVLKIFSNLELQEREKGDDYVVTASLSLDELVELTEDVADNADDIFELFEELGMDSDIDMDFDIEMVFDAEDKQITNLVFDISGDSLSDEEMEITKFEMAFKFKSFNKELDLSIPKKVKEEAVEEYEDFGGLDFGFGTEDLGDIEVDPEVDVEVEVKPEVEVEVEPEIEPETGSVLSGNWIDYDDIHFYVNGTKFTLGESTLQDMIDAGVPFEEEDLENANNNVKANYETDTFNIVIGEYWSANACFGNFTESGKAAKDCVICYLSFYTRDDEKQNIVTFDFPDDLTETELLTNAGEPTDLREYSDDPKYVSKYYEYQKESENYYSSYGYEFYFMNGVLKDITLDYVP